MYDMFIGGVSAAMEPALTTAVRELGEELGLGPMRDGNENSHARGGENGNPNQCPYFAAAAISLDTVLICPS